MSFLSVQNALIASIFYIVPVAAFASAAAANAAVATVAADGDVAVDSLQQDDSGYLVVLHQSLESL